jgi:hypothetical protein
LYKVRIYNIGRKDSWYKGNGMIMNTTGRRESLGSGEDHLMFREDGLEVLRYRGCLSCLYDMELGNNARMTFFEQIFHAIGTNDLGCWIMLSLMPMVDDGD